LSNHKITPLKIYFLTLFPKAIEAGTDFSILKKAKDSGRVQFHTIQIRDFATDRHKTVDDKPDGGGEGMLLRVDVLYRAWKKAVPRRPAAGVQSSTRTILLSPQGPRLTQDKVKELSKLKKLILVCGHYEGVDERFIELCVDEELSIGDFVLTGGEPAALVVADAVTRVLPGVVKNPDSLSQDSLEGGVLKYPQYTRPPTFRELLVPEILLNGNHKAILEWRTKERQERTLRKRPDLLKK
jgi:tRNA (guanine37-N1)-methyltransferase